jgi:hypothetical protein
MKKKVNINDLLATIEDSRIYVMLCDALFLQFFGTSGSEEEA